ncbi:MAG: arsenate reductase ArsC [Nitrospirae bacterium]|nr:arsenate reductase ArsC [Nitrospirota bacterium]
MPMKRRILFLCTGNSCRSQMAEGWLRHLGKDRFEVASAGIHPVGLNPGAVEVMREVGIEISGHRSKHVREFSNQRFDVVITVCDRAKESCPLFPGVGRVLHWNFDDPASAVGTSEERLAVFRRVRDEIQKKIRRFMRQGA